MRLKPVPGDRPAPPAGDGSLPQIHGHHRPLDGIRAIAALMVLVFHVAVESGAALAPGLRGALLSALELAVPLFFALSGVLLYRPWARAALDGTARPGVKRYLWRRALRVLPAYWVVAVLAMLLFSREQVVSVLAWLEVLTLTFVYNPDPWFAGTGPPGLGQMWSLCTEVAFYLLLPVLAVLLHRAARAGRDVNARARRLLAGLGALAGLSVAVLAIQFYPEPQPHMHAWLPRTLGLFAVGMALAVVSEWAWRESGPDGPVRRFCRTVAAAPATCWMVALGAYLISATPATGARFAGTEDIWSAVFQSLAAVIFAFFFLAPIALMAKARPVGASRWAGGGLWLRTIMESRTMEFLAKVSYGIFLWQFLVLYLWRDFTGQEPFTGSMALDLGPVLGGTILLAALTHRWIEVPTRRAYGLAAGRDLPRQPSPSSPPSSSPPSASASDPGSASSDSSAQGSPSSEGSSSP